MLSVNIYHQTICTSNEDRKLFIFNIKKRRRRKSLIFFPLSLSLSLSLFLNAVKLIIFNET